ncbi:MAG: 2OG-Fe(II) oxygenase [Deltaproteobacteria bacterium]|nr:2OG-Fe(II) oxygenase [Deltaproteobacteria bacterium]|tara:strand:+ start:498 stop:1073 length:576 start_codon:yes stop_codon:yes gene_type:complete
MSQVNHTIPYIFTQDDVLSKDECQQLIERIEEIGPSSAPINSIYGEVYRPSIRNNERIMFDDETLAQQLFNQVKDVLPKEVDGKTLLGANERIRCYRYKPGMQFAFHADGSFVRDEHERSYYSFLVYLNEEFEGGETSFLVEPETIITPETGMGLLFQHPIIHAGERVTTGTKYVVRTDIMYRDMDEQTEG